MKLLHKYLMLVAAPLVLSASCDNYDADDHKFDNAVYLDVSKTNEVQTTTFSNNRPSLDKSLQVTLAYPADQPVSVTLTPDASLVATYNARFGTNLSMLDAKYYELSAETVTIPAGKTTSEPITLRLKELMGEGEEQAGALPIDETYLLPVRISNASMNILRGSETAYYVVKRSSAITVAAQLNDNWIEFPTLDKYDNNSIAWNGLRAMTYEALIYIDNFVTQGSDGVPVNISSVMGVEQYLLLRIGDTNFSRKQLQFDGSGSGSAFGKFPEKNESLDLETGKWYHVACTYDQNTRIVRIYVNGKIQSEASDMGISLQTDDNKINLAMRALYDLYLQNPDNEEYKKKYGGFDKAYQFFIGYSYDEKRPLSGKIAEARVWSVARTPEQIWKCMYEIENPKDDPTLLGYWKFNEASGNEIKDYSRYGNDGKAKYDIVWPDGIEIPKINKVEE